MTSKTETDLETLWIYFNPRIFSLISFNMCLLLKQTVKDEIQYDM